MIVVDLSAELSAPRSVADWRAFPMLDLVVSDPDALCAVAVEIEHAVREAQQTGAEVTVCCALGLSRSAAAVAVWLAIFGGAANPAEAVSVLRARRPRIALGARDIAAISDACARMQSGIVPQRRNLAGRGRTRSQWRNRKGPSIVSP
jgi:predicted protein tyrosine phosphatase